MVSSRPLQGEKRDVGFGVRQARVWVPGRPLVCCAAWVSNVTSLSLTSNHLKGEDSHSTSHSSRDTVGTGWGGIKGR